MIDAINCKIRTKEPNNTGHRKDAEALERVIPNQIADI
jgi:hypothetical protein